MFDSIVLNRSIDRPSLTVGEIAEALVFYQNVHIVMDISTLLELIRTIGHNNVIKLLSLPDVKTTFIEDFVAVYTQDSGSGAEHSLISAYLSGNASGVQLNSLKKRLNYKISQQGLTKSETEVFIERFRKLIVPRRLASDHFISGGIIPTAREDLNDEDYVSAAARIIVSNLLAGQRPPEDLFYKIHNNKDTFRIDTNIDFAKINQFNINRVEMIGEATPASVARDILGASYGLILAGYYGGDFYTSSTESEIIQYRNKQILVRANTNRNELNSFHKIVLEGSPNISSIINEKERSFEEFLELLSRAKKFKHWLKNKSPDKNLVSSYLEEITTTGWLGSGYGKALRYIASTAAGFIGPTTGIVVSAIDAFFLDKLSLGWRPNQFINQKMKPFINTHDDL